MPCGVIDFGDVTRTLRVCELAVAASIAYGHEPDDPICAAAEIVRGFDAACPLDDAELEVLPHLIAARAAIVAVGTEQQAALEPHNAYAQRVRAGDWAICETAAAQPTALVDAVLRRACGRSDGRPLPARAAGPLAAPRRRARCRRRPLADRARPGHAARRDRRARRGALARDARALERRAGDDPPRPRRLRPGGQRGAGAAGRSRRARGRARARARGRRDRRAPGRARAHVAAGESVAAGSVVGRLAPGGELPPHLHVQVAPAGLTDAAGPRDAGPRGGLARALPASGRAALACRVPERRRARAARPPSGRDPAGAAALLRGSARDRARPAPASLRRAGPRLSGLRQQRRRRRTQPSARDGRRHAPAAPAQHELALPVREHDGLRRAAGGARCRTRSSGCSSSRPDRRPTTSRCASRARPRTGATSSASATPTTAGRPRPTRCRRAPSTTRWARCRSRRACTRCSRPTPTAAPMAPPGSMRGSSTPRRCARPSAGSRPSVALPPPSSARRCTATPAASSCPTATWRRRTLTCERPGGVCIADEVQVGYGRLGAHFWGFEQQGVVPDIVTIAKATGNGHPVAAVITTAAIADALEGQGGFFASVGGGPVSCEIGLAVLDVLEEEQLQENARRVGAVLRAGLEQLVDRHEIAGAAHGMGLYLGLDLVRDREPGSRRARRPLRSASDCANGGRSSSRPATARTCSSSSRRSSSSSATPTGWWRRWTACSRAAGSADSRCNRFSGLTD